MESDRVTLFNPSTFQNLAGDDDDKEDEEDQRHIEEQVMSTLPLCLLTCLLECYKS